MLTGALSVASTWKGGGGCQVLQVNRSAASRLCALKLQPGGCKSAEITLTDGFTQLQEAKQKHQLWFST